MHKKYTSKQVNEYKQKIESYLDNLHNKEVEKFHNRELDPTICEILTEIGQTFEPHIYHERKINQWTNWNYYLNNFKEHVEILQDNWTMVINAYKNRLAFNEEHKRQEKYMIYKYKHRIG